MLSAANTLLSEFSAWKGSNKDIHTPQYLVEVRYTVEGAKGPAREGGPGYTTVTARTKGHVVASPSPGRRPRKTFPLCAMGAARGHPAGRSRAALRISYRAARAPAFACAHRVRKHPC
jgi:hypothetical protein